MRSSASMAWLSFSTKRSCTLLCTRKRFEHTHVCGSETTGTSGDVWPAPRSQRARLYLSRVPELGAHGAAHGLVHVGAVEHDEGGVATQLHGHLLHGVGSHLEQHLRWETKPEVMSCVEQTRLNFMCTTGKINTYSDILTFIPQEEFWSRRLRYLNPAFQNGGGPRHYLG